MLLAHNCKQVPVPNACNCMCSCVRMSGGASPTEAGHGGVIDVGEASLDQNKWQCMCKCMREGLTEAGHGGVIDVGAAPLDQQV
jgi:hypothetical protein